MCGRLRSTGLLPRFRCRAPPTRASPAAPQTTCQDDPTQRAAPVARLDVLRPRDPREAGQVNPGSGSGGRGLPGSLASWSSPHSALRTT